MDLPLAATICLLLAGLSHGQDTGAENKNTSTLLSANSTTNAPEPVLTPMLPPNLNVTAATEMVPDATTRTNPSDTPQQPTDTSSKETAKGEGATTKEVLEGSTTTAATSRTPTNTASTVQSIQSKTENQSSNHATEKPVTTVKPGAPLSEVSTLLPTSETILQNTSRSPAGPVDASNASPSSTSPSYSSVILPMVIALIVITLSVFVLVGLYRICRKTDPGTQDNGSDQPQSDKESVKLLTVKTISHEPGEHAAHGKSKN